jgi:hypothetical protein
VQFISKAIVFSCLLSATKSFVPPCRSATVAASSRAHNHFVAAQQSKHLPSYSAKDDIDTFDATMPTSAPDLSYQFVSLVGKSASSLVSISFFLLLATRRDAVTLTLFIGSIYNAVSSKVLKKILNHERPANLQLNENVKLKPSEGGMVSTIVESCCVV